ncbi:MAG: asparagine--tRNA ligase [Eubacteriaceae bacterium]|nr:asparagine--tRNA ligase [Eubacteriaceae bacterium]
MKHTDICDLKRDYDKLIGSEVTLCGWIKTMRNSKQICFIEINDGTSLSNVQIVIDKENFEDTYGVLKQIVGASLKVSGLIVASPGSKQPFEVAAKQIEVLGSAPADYPLQKKAHSLEYLRTIPHLRVRTNTFNAMFRLRSQLAYAVHDFFRANNFVYVHTPIITGSDCEGAGEVFNVTVHNYGDVFASQEEYDATDFFRRKSGLTVSGQLEGETMAMGLGKIYTFGPTFRAENSFTPKHAAEFWMIEPEVAFADLNDIIDLAQRMIKYITNHCLATCSDELVFFRDFFEKGLLDKLDTVANSEYAVCDYTEAITLLEKADRKFDYPVSWGLDLQTEHERYLTEEIFKRPTFVVNYPKEIKSFYMKQNPDGKTVAASDLLVPGIGEIIGGSQREDDYGKLIEVMQSRGMNLDDYKYYLDLRKYGSAPHSGYGLGFDRMLMYITGIGNIRDTIPYPRTTGSLL